MEGRISREELLTPVSSDRSARFDEPSGAYRDGAYKENTYKENVYRRPVRSRPSATSSYRRSRKAHGIIPEGRDLFIVQALASGFLLLLVLVTALVKTETTRKARESLHAALSKSSTVAEAYDTAKGAVASIASGAGTVLEIFGGEIEKEPDIPLDELNELSGLNADGAHSEITDEPSVQIFEGGASVDSETMEYILENAKQDGTAKN